MGSAIPWCAIGAAMLGCVGADGSGSSEALRDAAGEQARLDAAPSDVRPELLVAAEVSSTQDSGFVADAAEATSRDIVSLDALPIDGASDLPIDVGPGFAFHYYDINHILSTGQSLSVGARGSPPLSVSQPYDNKMFQTGVGPSDAPLTSFVPLVEGWAGVETMSSGLANMVTKMAREEVFKNAPPGQTTHDLLVSGHGLGGTPYSGLKKGSAVYAIGMAQLQAGIALSAAASRTYVVRAVTLVHGETDHVEGNAAYADDLALLQSDYETDIRAATGQTEPVPMFETQMSNWTAASLGGARTSAIPQAQLAAANAHPDEIFLVGPKYMLSTAPDGVHLTNAGYRWMGEYYAKAYRRVVLEGKRWVPVRPVSVSIVGAEITVVFDVPAPPLVLDTTLVSDPGSFGFEYWDDSAAPVAIVTVAVAGPTTVEITLAGLPTGAGRRIRYAFTGNSGAPAGPTTGPRGNLRDSDTTPSPNGNALFNWAVHFDEAVP